MNLLSNLRNTNQRVEPKMNDKPVGDQNLPYAPPDVRASRFSEEAAKAAQYVLDLENKVKRLNQDVTALTSHIQVIEESNALLHEEIKNLKAENSRLAHVSSVIETRLHVATETLLGIKAVIPPREVDVTAGVEAALTQPVAEKVAEQ
jgi:outer membrane murein-binding lipoprotein Lpp